MEKRYILKIKYIIFGDKSTLKICFFFFQIQEL